VDVVLEVFLIFVAAKLAAELFVRLQLPAIAGELVVGVLLGPHVADAVKINQATTALSQLGVVILLFTVGLETPLPELLSRGKSALVSSLAGIAAAGLTGALVFRLFGLGMREALLAGTALAASSVGVAARVFQDLRLVATPPARVVMGAAVVDDVVVLALFPLVQGFGKHGAPPGGAVIGVAGALAFVVLVAVVGSRLAGRHAGILEAPRVRRSPFILALAFCLGMAALAERVGLAALVGAFLAGMVLAGTRDRYELDRRMLPLFDFLVPFFFVITAAQMDLGMIFSGGAGLAVTLCLVTLVAKVAGCGGGALGLDLRERLQVGAGMIPRNEVTLVVASAGLASGILDQRVFAVLGAAVLVSTLAAPLALRVVVPRRARPEREPFGEGPPEAPRTE
jgi:Kef-type K+ transport system membrane component KefB